ncbi:hypothetical protein EAF04_008959 [Stromatinia cepivora]|nr:hypothetical protein EAF04_008959 [Stromatinia cepivora]
MRYWHELMKPRIKYGSRRHAYLVLGFVLPEFRRRGAATQLVKWGIEKADELDMICLLDAAPVEKVLYETSWIRGAGRIRDEFQQGKSGCRLEEIGKAMFASCYFANDSDQRGGLGIRVESACMLPNFFNNALYTSLHTHFQIRNVNVAIFLQLIVWCYSRMMDQKEIYNRTGSRDCVLWLGV